MISEFWTFGLQNPFVRTREPFFSNLRTFELKNLRTHEPSNLRTFGLMGCNHFRTPADWYLDKRKQLYFVCHLSRVSSATYHQNYRYSGSNYELSSVHMLKHTHTTINIFHSKHHTNRSDLIETATYDDYGACIPGATL